MKWRDVPVGEIGYSVGLPFRRVTDALVDFSIDGVSRGPHVEVEYLRDGAEFKVGDRGLIGADDDAEDRNVFF